MDWNRVEVYTQPSERFLSLSSVKSWLRITGTSEDDTLNLLIDSVNTTLNQHGVYPIDTTLREYYYAQPSGCVFTLTGNPVKTSQTVAAVNASNTAIAGDVLPVLPARFRAKDGFARVYRSDLDDDATDSSDAWLYRIEYQVGFGSTTGSIPNDLQMAALGEVTQLYEIRDGSGTLTPLMKSTLSKYSLWCV